MIGQLISHYRVLRQLGAGGMGVVYLARDEQLGREVAIKLLSPGTLADESSRLRFRDEAQILAQLNHPNIEMVFEFGTVSDREFLVLEYVPGQTLRELIASGSLPEEKVLRLGSMLAAGLEAAHAKGILHRDLKPGNLIVTPEGRLKILDFGLAVTHHAVNPEQDKRLAGTLPYMPPEHLRGEAGDVRGDIYSAGAVLYEIATGKPPFEGAGPSELTDSILHESPPGPRELNARISPLCEAFLLKALQKAPEDRQQSAAELRGELERIYASRQPSSVSRALDQSQAPTLEMSYVLFMDIVGYSRLATDTQQFTLRQLQRIVRGSAEFQRGQAENRLIRLPTGDGMALAFFTDPEAPVRCAIEVSRALKDSSSASSEIPLRIGMHAGPVYRVTDINGNQNVAGEGINVAQRVMDCGDAGHVLVSKVLADVLRQLSGWSGALRDLGAVKVKHGLEIHVYNLLFEGVGNAALPQKVQVQGERTQARGFSISRSWVLSGVATLLVLAILGFGFRKYLFKSDTPTTLGEASSHARRPTVAILGFKNLNNSSETNWISITLADMLTNELEAGDHLIATPGEDVARAKRDLSLSDDIGYGGDTIQRIHKTLHCDYLIYGSFFARGKAAGNTVRLSLRVQNASSGEVIASVTENGTEPKLDELASHIGGSLRSKLNLPSISPAESDAIQAAIPSSEATKPFYLGIERLRNFDFLGARELLQKAIASDPNFGPAHAALAQAWIGLGYDMQAREEAQKAFDLSKHLPREDQLLVEARFREISTEWDKAVAIYQSLWTVYPENPEYALRAADVLIRAGRGSDALKTIQMLRGQPGPIATDPRLDLKEAEAYDSLGDFSHQKEAATRAANKAQDRGSRLLQAEALWRVCEASLNLGDAAGARPSCQKAVSIAQPLNDLLLVARATSVLGHISEAEGKPDDALAAHRQALDYAQKIGSRRDVTGALINVGNVQSMRGNHAEAERSFDQALKVAREINDQNQVIALLNNLAVENQLTGNYPLALHLYQESLGTARSIHDQAVVGRTLNNIGTIYSLQGNFPLAQQNIQEAMKTSPETGTKSDQVGFLYALGDIKLAQGDLAEAESSYQSAESLASQINDKMNVALGQLSLANLRLSQGKTDEALALARQAAQEFHAEGMRDQESQAKSLVAAGLLDLNKPADAALELALAQQLLPQDPTVKMMVAITAARIAVRSGKATQGKKDLESVVAQARRLGLPGLQLEARLALAEAGLYGADKRSSLATLSALQEEASRKGYKQFVVRAKEIANQLSASSPA